MFQAFNLVPTLSVRENILLPFELAGRRVDAAEQQWIDHLVHTLGLADRVRHRPSELSGGQQQRVAIARALASRPAVIFADEPTGNLDSRSSREVLTLLRTAAREYGQTIAMVSHDPVAASYADRILVIADGRLVADHGALSPAADLRAAHRLRGRCGMTRRNLTLGSLRELGTVGLVAGLCGTYAATLIMTSTVLTTMSSSDDGGGAAGRVPVDRRRGCSSSSRSTSAPWSSSTPSTR